MQWKNAIIVEIGALWFKKWFVVFPKAETNHDFQE